MSQDAAPAGAGDKGFWTLWRIHLWRWLLMDANVGLTQPVGDDLDHFWPQKVSQMLIGGMLLGLAYFTNQARDQAVVLGVSVE